MDTDAAPIDLAELSPQLASLVLAGPPPLTEQEIDAIYGVGLGYYGRERFSEAGDVFRLLVLLRPRQARVWLALAASHEAVCDDERAIALYRVAAATPAPTDVHKVVEAYLARLLAKVGRHDEARELVESIPVDDEDDEAMARLVLDLRRALCDTQPSLERAS